MEQILWRQLVVSLPCKDDAPTSGELLASLTNVTGSSAFGGPFVFTERGAHIIAPTPKYVKRLCAFGPSVVLDARVQF